MRGKRVDYERAQAVVLQDKLGTPDEAFFTRLAELVSQYMQYDGLSVQMTGGKSSNMLISISVKKVRAVLHPTE